MTAKYIFENGKMKKNPQWELENNAAKPSAPPIATHTEQLAIVCSPDDIAQATEVQEAKGVSMEVAESTQIAFATVDNEKYLNKFAADEKLEGNDLLEQLTSIFAAYEVPIGMLKKLFDLQGYNLNFIIDDSGSMVNATDSTIGEASGYMLDKLKGLNPRANMSRWQEAEDRLHTLLDLLAYVPTGKIQISFLNKPGVTVLERNGMTPIEFAMTNHDLISSLFKSGPNGVTPIYAKLQEAFNPYSDQATMHYLLSDGVPSDASVDKVANLISTRKNPHLHPLTLLSCTNNDKDTEWMKEIEEAAPFVVELDDYKDECVEVQHDQGAAFPYTKGLWLLCTLVGAINPHDLDALDDKLPLTKYTLDNILGRVHTEQEYEHYWKFHPHAKAYQSKYANFATEEKFAKQIIDPTAASSMMSALSSGMAKLRFR